ncbi:hypothetical protein KIN20_028386 [Parelaphostrongylus tenuis]|uniref:Uncharacterized protein n=1 Tax=Parelaphostrongylus tenuis TaxID=148309 RepID=A0AAD5R0V6_PARTN|nr:hypothetical protein KIN20_028386 [Parelaphostrongylus tenuis]
MRAKSGYVEERSSIPPNRIKGMAALMREKKKRKADHHCDKAFDSVSSDKCQRQCSAQTCLCYHHIDTISKCKKKNNEM